MVQYYQAHHQPQARRQQQQNYYEQQPQPQSHGYYGNIPVGRPLQSDNNSSFASDYPSL